MTESIKRLDFEGEIRKRVGAKFFSACFIKKDDSTRVANCKFNGNMYTVEVTPKGRKLKLSSVSSLI